MSGASQTHTMMPPKTDSRSAELSTWARGQLQGGREQLQQRYAERFGITKPEAKAEPAVEIRYVAAPPPEDTRSLEEKLEDAELAVLVARHHVEQAKESRS